MGDGFIPDITNVNFPRVAQQQILSNTVGTINLQDGAVTDLKVTSIAASKITAGTVIVGVNVPAGNIQSGTLQGGVNVPPANIQSGTLASQVNLGTSAILLDGTNGGGPRIIFYNSGTPSIVIGSPT